MAFNVITSTVKDAGLCQACDFSDLSDRDDVSPMTFIASMLDETTYIVQAVDLNDKPLPAQMKLCYQHLSDLRRDVHAAL